MDKEKSKQKDIKNICKSFFKVFALVVNDYETSKHDIDFISLENLFIQSIESLGRILSSSYVVEHDIQLNASKEFGIKHFSYIQFISSILINIIDLPILFTKKVRLTAIRQIGKMISRIGWLKDPKYQRIVYSTAKSFQSRITASSKISSDFECAYIFALSRMALDPQLQDILLKVIESYIPILTSNPTSTTQGELNRDFNDIKISICKALQRLEQSPDRLYKIMKSLAEDMNAHPEVSSEASLTFLSISIKTNKGDTVTRITRGLSELIMNSKRPSNVKSAIKMLYTICSNYPSQKNNLLAILMKFIKSDTPYHRDYALYILSKLEIELNHKEYVTEIADIIKRHFLSRIALNDQTNNHLPFILKYVTKAAAVICSHYVEYAAMLSTEIDNLLKVFTFTSSSLIDVKLAFNDEEIQKASKSSDSDDKNSDSENNDNPPKKAKRSIEIDPFDGYKLEQPQISPNSIVVYTWRREVGNLQQLLNFEMQVPEIGYAKSAVWFSAPKGFQIYEDVVAHFVLCCAYPDRSGITLGPFFQHLADTRGAAGRNTVTWEQIAAILDKFTALNYVQLFFVLCLMQMQKQEKTQAEVAAYSGVEAAVVKGVLVEMLVIYELLSKQKQEKLAKRTPTGEPPSRRPK